MSIFNVFINVHNDTPVLHNMHKQEHIFKNGVHQP